MNNSKNYVALHNHTHYSTLDGYATVDEYIKAAVDNGMEGIGLADHGTASGLYKFITRAQKAGITPVPGIEFYVAPENPEGAKVQGPIYYGEGGIKAPQYDVSNGAYTHMTVFAYNNVGLSNLFKLTSLSWKPENFYFKPRIDTNMLAEHSEGLIVTTGCPSSEVNRRFLLGQDDKAYEYANRLKSIFGENLYVEIMDHSMEDEELERILMPRLIKLSKELDIPLIATNDSHYAFKGDAKAHERILAVATKSDMDTLPFYEGGTRFAFSTDEYYIKPYDEMKKLYPAEVAEEALANTVELMNKCKDIKLDYDPHLRPEIEIPEGYSAPTYLQKLIYDGFKLKRSHETKEVQAESVKRIQEEFTVLHSNDFIDYFLVVHDYIDYAHKNDIGVGAGRGSVGGSEIAYLLDISNTDPIRFDLLFERFLSPGRGSLYQIEYMSGDVEEIAVSGKKLVHRDGKEPEVIYVHELYPGDLITHGDGKEVIKKVFVKIPGSAPDVDTDFHTKRREEVIQYCVAKYGEENVSNIVTFGTFKAKSAFKAIAKVYNVPYARSNVISQLIPGGPGVDVSLSELMDPTSRWYNEAEEFRRAVENDSVLAEVVEIASALDGRISDTSVHPCGVIIANQPISNAAPMMIRQEDNKLVSQWEYPELEALGLIKMDFLGLELIDTVQQAVENIVLTNNGVEKEEDKLIVPDMRELILGPMDDPKVYENLKNGHTVGIFQLGNSGVRDLLPRVKPDNFMDIANVTALYRPGPLSAGAHMQYADRKNGIEEVSYIHDDFKGTAVQDILDETYGVLVFQEQTMRIAGRYAGMTPYETDQLRSAIGKKKMDIMMRMKPMFINGCLAQGASKVAANRLWDMIEAFGEYGFNKSHSVSYALNIYQSLYLKSHYPREFMSALIQQGFGNPNKVRLYIQEAVRMGLKLGHVDINTSQLQMASTGVDPKSEFDIVFGFSSVKQTNDTLGQAIVDERNANGLYKSVADFVKRVSGKTQLTAAPLASLAIAGAFDCFGVSRKQVSEKAKMLISSGELNANRGASLFDMMGTGAIKDVSESIELEGEEFDYNELIKLEADRIGMFVSGHPTAKLGHIAKRFSPKKMSDVLKTGGTREVFNVLGTITHKVEKSTKAGNKSIAVLMDDGSTTNTTYLPREMTKRIEKGEEIARLARARERGATLKVTKRSERLAELVNDPSIEAMDPIELNEPYLFKMTTRGWGEEVSIQVVDVERLVTAPDGSLPFELNIMNQGMGTRVKAAVKEFENKKGAFIKINNPNGDFEIIETRVKLSIQFIVAMEKIVGKENIVTEGI